MTCAMVAVEPLSSMSFPKRGLFGIRGISGYSGGCPAKKTFSDRRFITRHAKPVCCLIAWQHLLRTAASARLEVRHEQTHTRVTVQVVVFPVLKSLAVFLWPVLTCIPNIPLV